MDWQWHKGALQVTKLVSVFHRKRNEEFYLVMLLEMVGGGVEKGHSITMFDT